MGIPKQRTQFSTRTTHKQEVNPKILNILIQLKNNGKSDYTIRNADKFLNIIDKNADLDNPEEVKAFIANHQVSRNTKECYSYAYRIYCKHYKIKAKIPFWKPDAKPIKLPTNEKLEMLISASSPQMAIKLIISKECGLRPIEIFTLKVKDIDLEKKLLYPTTAKHGAPRTLKVSQRLKQAIEEHITKNNLKNEDKLFKGNATYYGKSFRYTRNKLAEKLHDQTIKTIRLYDFRHYYGTTTYKKTNLIYTMQQMGHKRIETTMIYMHLADIPQDEEWINEKSANIEQDGKLIYAGFEYITERDGIKLFRKRK